MTVCLSLRRLRQVFRTETEGPLYEQKPSLTITAIPRSTQACGLLLLDRHNEYQRSRKVETECDTTVPLRGLLLYMYMYIHLYSPFMVDKNMQKYTHRQIIDRQNTKLLKNTV